MLKLWAPFSCPHLEMESWLSLFTTRRWADLWGILFLDFKIVWRVSEVPPQIFTRIFANIENLWIPFQFPGWQFPQSELWIRRFWYDAIKAMCGSTNPFPYIWWSECICTQNLQIPSQCMGIWGRQEIALRSSRILQDSYRLQNADQIGPLFFSWTHSQVSHKWTSNNPLITRPWFEVCL